MRAIVYLAFAGMMLATAREGVAQDAAAGEMVFKKCQVCHIVDSDKNKVGPSLMGVIGRAAGTHEGFKYSTAMADAGKTGVIWDEPTLTTYLHDPKAFIKGTKMAFVGLKADDEVANVIAYLKQFPK